MVWTVSAEFSFYFPHSDGELNGTGRLGELMLHISVYISFIVYQKLNPENGIKGHLRYRRELLKKILTHLLFDVAPYHAGTTPPNMLRLIERHFISQVPSTPGKPRELRRCIRCAKLGTRRDTRFWCRRCGVGLCLSICFKFTTHKKLYQGVGRWWRRWLVIFSSFCSKFICLLVYIYDLGILLLIFGEIGKISKKWFTVIAGIWRN